MSLQISHDRTSQLVLAADKSLTYDEARRRLEQASLYLTVSDPAQPWAQGALLAIAASGTRMFRGGVFIDETISTPLVVDERRRMPLDRAMRTAGCRTEIAPAASLHIHVGSSPAAGAHLYCWASGWCANTAPQGDTASTDESNVLAGVLAGAMAV